MAMIYWPEKCEWESPRIRCDLLCSLPPGCQQNQLNGWRREEPHSHNENSQMNSNGQVTSGKNQPLLLKAADLGAVYCYSMTWRTLMCFPSPLTPSTASAHGQCQISSLLQQKQTPRRPEQKTKEGPDLW